MLGYEPEQIEDFDHLYREKCNEVTMENIGSKLFGEEETEEI